MSEFGHLSVSSRPGPVGCHPRSLSRAEGRGTKDSPVCTRAAKHPLIWELRLHLRRTAGLSVGSDPPRSHPPGWPSSLLGSSCQAWAVWHGASCLSASIYREGRYFVNKPCRGRPTKTAQWDYRAVFSLSISLKRLEQQSQLKPTDGSQGRGADSVSP